MPPKQKRQPANPETSLGDTVTQFLLTVSPETSSETQQEIFKFIRWFGGERKILTITSQEIANYSDQFQVPTAQATTHLNAVKQFLAYAFKQGFINSNLAAHLKVKKISAKSQPSTTGRIGEEVALTRQGYEELKGKLAALKEERPKIVEELRRAASDKDFRENAPLEAAREKQGHIEGQILELENTLKNARIIQASVQNGMKVTMGDTILVTDVASGEKINYTLVSSKEANIQLGKISLVSPMGQALFNKEVGDIFEVSAPSGIIKYKIMNITRG
jgi:transcription elongation factor GreA